MKLSLLLLPLLLLFSCNEETPLAHTNVIIILTDDMGYADLSCFGSTLNQTPNLDKMAEEGAQFTGYYAGQPICSASRASILTGCYPNRVGIHNAMMPDSKIGINLSEITIAEMLKKEGYHTGAFGKWHLGDDPKFLPLNHGFDEYIGIPYSNDMWPFHPQQGPVFNFKPLPLIQGNDVIDTLTDQSNLTVDLTNHSVDFIKRHKEEPFFLYLAHPQPHVPLFVSDKFKGKSENGLYGDVMLELDWSVGEILQTLKELELDKNTLVIFTSDNGPWKAYGNHAGNSGIFREAKGTSWEGGHRTPFIVSFPGKISADEKIQTPFYAMDILPTVAKLTGAELPHLKIDGLDVWDIWTGETKENPHEIFLYYYKVNELHAIRYGDWKMVFPHRYRTMHGQEPGKDGLPGSYRFIDMERTELYNLKDDPSETVNVFAENLNIVAEIEKYAERARKDLGDALTDRIGEGLREVGRVE
ncbi:sulfatase family protein [Portibacter lacus]|uniref:Arylsulfatase n=1 Tax=Portibacter lacus TaxID=1099794 RepID=A0AA37WDY8_9BACT|nr:sulfatase [Portibacter lacus]GLR17413.1 arylsulfatase [Portibacter lacus]